MGCDVINFFVCRLSVWIWRTIPPLFLIIGTIGNGIIVTVYSRKNMRRFSTNIYLLVLGISDTLVLWTTVLEQTLKHGFGVDYLSLSSLHCRTITWLAYACATFSSFTVVNVTVERAIFLAFPIRAKYKLTPKVAMIVCLVSMVIAQAGSAHFIFGYSFRDTMNEITNGNDTILTQTKLCTRASEEFDQFYRFTWDYIVLICFTLIPLCILIAGNVSICLSIRSSKRRIHIHQNSINRNTGSSSADKGQAVVKILFFLSLGYIVCTLPYTFYWVIHDTFGELTPTQEATDALVYAIVHILMYCNFTIGFVVYYSMSTLFRTECKKVLTSVNCLHEICICV